jgi:pimeloyl-ACP methyl ester carboxylesterase
MSAPGAVDSTGRRRSRATLPGYHAGRPRRRRRLLASAPMGLISERETQQIEAAKASGRTPVVLIHGLWLLPSSWAHWAQLFEEASYAALTPGWPDDPETVEEARANPDVFAKKTLGQIADHTAEVIGKLDKKPAVMGHSTGGLVAQMIADRGLSAATVAIAPGPFRGVLSIPISALRSAIPVLKNPLNRGRAVTLSQDEFKYGWTNALGDDEAKQLYDTYHVAAPGVALMQQANANLNPFTEAKLDQQPRTGAAADHRWREGSHGALGNRERLFQAPATQRRRYRDQENPQRRPFTDYRQRLARGRRNGAAVREAVRRALAAHILCDGAGGAGSSCRASQALNSAPVTARPSVLGKTPGRR